MRYAVGDGMTLLESPHMQIVNVGPVCNGQGMDERDWTTLPAYQRRLERAKRDIEAGLSAQRVMMLADSIDDEMFDLWISIMTGVNHVD